MEQLRPLNFLPGIVFRFASRKHDSPRCGQHLAPRECELGRGFCYPSKQSAIGLLSVKNRRKNKLDFLKSVAYDSILLETFSPVTRHIILSSLL